MATKKKLLQAAAGAAGGAGLNVEDVFSTYLYEGNSSTQTITNGIDLDGEGGLVWTKDRDTAVYHALTDTERGGQYALYSSTADAQVDRGSDFITSFNSNGYSIGADGLLNDTYNYVSWTFRKAPKFFDVVTYSGSASSQSIAHNLGSTPGLIITKKLDSSGNWAVYHRSLGATKYILLNSTNEALTGSTFWNDTEPTSTHFTVGTNDATNNSVRDYVAYLFAHNDGDGEFGSTADQDIIKCGSYTGNGSSTGPEIDLGFEPQWLLVKNANSSTSDWLLLDVMRGWGMGDADIFIEPNTTGGDQGSQNWVDITSTGFKITNSNGQINGSSNTHIYIAIRRGPMAVPTDATDVFGIDTATSGSPGFTSGFVVDAALARYGVNTTGSNTLSSRLQGNGKYLVTSSTGAEATASSYTFDYNTGWADDNGTVSNFYSWMWKRAPNFFDVVTYTGDGTYPSSRSLKHNLGVAPELMIYKNRSRAGQEWEVHLNVTGTDYLRAYLSTNLAAAGSGSSLPYGDYGATPDADNVYIRGGGFTVNNSGDNYIAYLFASLDGVSKVGSITGTGSDQTIDCGFSNGARFVLIKRTSSTSNWWLFDTERGIAVGSDPILRLDTTEAEGSSDIIDPHSSGFTINSTFAASGVELIYYAIA